MSQEENCHYSDAAPGTIPSKFICGRKCKEGRPWTDAPDFVECKDCRERLYERRLREWRKEANV